MRTASAFLHIPSRKRDFSNKVHQRKLRAVKFFSIPDFGDTLTAVIKEKSKYVSGQALSRADEGTRIAQLLWSWACSISLSWCYVRETAECLSPQLGSLKYFLTQLSSARNSIFTGLRKTNNVRTENGCWCAWETTKKHSSATTLTEASWDLALKTSIVLEQSQKIHSHKHSFKEAKIHGKKTKGRNYLQ